VTLAGLCQAQITVGPNSTNVTTYALMVDVTDGVTIEKTLDPNDYTMVYVRPRALPVVNTATGFSGAAAAHVDWRSCIVDDHNCPGLYRFDWPDAAFAGGVPRVELYIYHVGAKPVHETVDLAEIQTGDTYGLVMPSWSTVVNETADTKANVTDLHNWWKSGGSLYDKLETAVSEVNEIEPNVADLHSWWDAGGILYAMLDALYSDPNAANTLNVYDDSKK
jgi:hypothetical protein